MELLRKHRKTILAVLIILLFAGLWLFIWLRVSDALRTAQQDEAYSGFVFDGACYTRIDTETLKLYTDTPVGESLCGTLLGTVPFTTAHGTEHDLLYACKDVPYTQYAPAVLLRVAGRYLPYELTGFSSIGDAPSAAEVLAAYGITGAESLVSVSVTEANGTPVDTITEPDDLKAFYEKLSALGEDIGEDGEMQAYYDAYRDKYPDDARVTLKDGEIQYADDESRQLAMTLWSDGMCLVSITLNNGLRLRNMVYAPVPGFFALYGIYRLNTPFFK